MNWYFEKDGISQGPLTENALAARVRAAELNADSLIWHSGLEDWQTVHLLRPDWLANSASSATSSKPTTTPATVPAKPIAKTNTPPRKAAPRPLEEIAPPPIAATPAPAPAPTPAAKPGLLKRLFGFGKSK